MDIMYCVQVIAGAPDIALLSVFKIKIGKLKLISTNFCFEMIGTVLQRSSAFYKAENVKRVENGTCYSTAL